MLITEELPSLSELELKIIQNTFEAATKDTKDTKGKVSTPHGGRTGYHVFLDACKAEGTSHADAQALWQSLNLEEKNDLEDKLLEAIWITR